MIPESNKVPAEKRVDSRSATSESKRTFLKNSDDNQNVNTEHKSCRLQVRKKLRRFGAWIKNHLQIILPIVTATILVTVISCSVFACITNQNNGTYYKIWENGAIDRDSYYIIKSNKWQDNNGNKGTYKKNGDKVLIYIKLASGDKAINSGTLFDKVLKINDNTYVHEKHTHSANESGWHFDDDKHWQICSICEVKFNYNDHTNNNNCTICGYPYFEYTLNSDKSYYTIIRTQFKEPKTANIPNKFKGIPVTAIGKNAFAGYTSLKNITIPNSVTMIDDSAFYGCSKLKSITIPNSVSSIGERAFYGCKMLTNITIPDSVSLINNSTFHNCSRLTSIIIPNNVTSIGERAFCCCSKLMSVTLPDNVTNIGDYTFSDCCDLTNIIIPNGVTNIGNYMFSNCSKLTNISLPENITSIGKYAFSNCKKLTSLLIPDKVTSIGERAFNSCGKLQSIAIPNSITSIDSYVFSDCNGLTSIAIPESVQSIREYAFYSCDKLKSVIIPESVTNIEKNAFYSCSKLEDIYFNGNKAHWLEIEKDKHWIAYAQGNVLVHCTDGDLNKAGNEIQS